MNRLRNTIGPMSHGRLARSGFIPGRERGQSMTEYAIIGGILAALLFAATSPVGQVLTTALHNFYQDLTFFLSLP
ncbi:MAG TPA: Flp family type IVb pilin [Steroidobacteraceae bacterium]|nr:Flp family type IVb pilin [Steroidobacteraceae bacterium]